jgi:DNA-binding phage protein
MGRKVNMAAKANVVHLTLVQKRSANSAVASSGINDEEQEFLSDLRGLVWNQAGRINGSWKGLGEKANLNYKTLQKFASGETRRPQFFTIRRICQAVNCTLSIKSKSKR